MYSGDPVRRAGTLIFAGVAQFFIFLFIAESLYPDYSVSAQPISDLGATCRAGVCTILQPSAAIFDLSVFVLGAFVFIGAFFLYISRSRLVGGMLALSGWGAMGVAIFPETTGPLHTIVSFIVFFFGGVAAIASYRMLRSPLSYFSVVLGAVTLVAVLGLYASGTYLGLGQGGMERMVAYPVLIWGAGFGAYLMSHVQREPTPFRFDVATLGNDGR